MVTESGTYYDLLKFVAVVEIEGDGVMTAWFRSNGDFSRFIAEYQQEPSESETDDVDASSRISDLKVCDAMVCCVRVRLL